MKKKVLLALLAVAAVVPLFGIATAVSANNFRSGDEVTIKKDETIDRNLYVMGTNIEVAGTVDGDVYCLGTNAVTISGKVKGDVLCASPAVKIDGQVDGDIRVVGQTVSLKGDIAGNASAFADTFTLEDGSRVRDVTTVATTTIIDGEVMRDLVANGESTAINAKVGRDISAHNQRLALGQQSTVGGSIHLTSDNKVEKAEGSQVLGNITEVPATDPSRNQFLEFIVTLIVTVAGALLMAMVAFVIAPKALHTVTNDGLKKLGISFLIGAGTIIVVPIIAVFSLMTLIGTFTGISLLIVLLALMIASFPVTAYLFGRLLLQKNTNNAVYYVLLGASIIAVGTFVPVLGALLVLAVLFFGVGMLVYELFLRNRTVKLAGTPVASKKAAAPRKK